MTDSTKPTGPSPTEPPKILVVGGGMEYIRMFYEAGYVGATSVEDADIVCFTGGADVDPQLYGEKALNTTNFDVNRDKRDIEVYHKANAYGTPMVGICRGGQFLNVMNKGKMWQHVNGHGRPHSILDSLTGDIIPDMTSTHHQMMRPGPKAIVLATACESTSRQNESQHMTSPHPMKDDVEAVWYDDTKSLCFQPHPEFSKGSCRDYFMSLMEDFIIPLLK